MAVCGDSTFYHAVIPALINAQHNRADITFIVLDNAGTAMTGFQPHPGINESAIGEPLPSVDIAAICQAIGAKVAVSDPFDLEGTSKILTSFMAERGSLKVLIYEADLRPESRKEGQETISDES